MRLPLQWPRASLRTYLVAVMLIATVPIALLMAWQIFNGLRDQGRALDTELRRGAAAAAQAVQHEIDASIDTLTVVSRSDELARGDLQGFAAQLPALSGLRAGWSALYLLGADGRPLLDGAAAGPLPPEHGLSGEARVSDLLGSGDAGPAQVTVDVPVRVGGELRYRLGARIPAQVLQRLIEQQPAAEGGVVALADARLHLIARTPQPGLQGRALPPEVMSLVRSADSGSSRLAGIDDKLLYMSWQRVAGTRWTVGAGVPAAPIDAAQERAVSSAVLTAAACLLLGVTLALLVSRRISRPLSALARGGPARAIEDIPVREIARLRDALLAAEAQDAAARSRLQSKADEFETLFNSSPIGLAFAQDPQCRSVLHNRAMNELFGPPGQTGTLASVRVLHRGQRLERAQQPLQRAAAEGIATTDMELELLIEGQPGRHVIAHAVPLRDASGRPRGAIGVLVDITERKRAESELIAADRRLLESQRLVNLAQEAGGVGFFHYRFEADAASWTMGQARLFGFPAMPQEGSLADWLQRVHEDDRDAVRRTIRDMLAGRQERVGMEFRVAMPDGSERWLSARVLVAFDDAGRPLQLTGVSVNVTQQKQAERERAALVQREQAARLEAEAASRAKDEFLAMLGHELRNPLSAISSAVEVIHRVDADSELAANARDIMARQTRHLARLMDDLLDVARVISGKVLLSRHRLDLAALAQRCAETLEMTGEAAAHVLRRELQEVWVEADGTRIEQVANNLLTNALKYTPAGREIVIAVRHEGDEAVLEVRDSGLGIPAALLPRIFDLFVQGERTLDRRAGGLGIGLTLVRRLVELHGGSVHAASTSEGSVFTVRLPAVPAPERPQATSGLPRGRRRRVAVVEDNADALASLRALLELDGHAVETATDGESGLELVLRTRPDIAVVDIGLPGITGYELARRCRAGGHTGRMIAISGYGQDKDVREALVSGFDAHLVKPVDPEGLRSMMAED